MEMTLEQKLVADLKEMGLEVTEEVAVKLLDVLLTYASAKVLITENKFDDMLIAVLPLIKAELAKLADMIDGKEG